MFRSPILGKDTAELEKRPKLGLAQPPVSVLELNGNTILKEERSFRDGENYTEWFVYTISLAKTVQVVLNV